MEKNNLYLLIICCLLGAVYATDETTKLFGQKQVNNWCIARLTAPPEKMQGFLDYACGLIDCGAIQLGGSCFDPDLLPSHANYALNFYYKSRGVCNPDIGSITTIDPCNYSLYIYIHICMYLMAFASIH
ncbi:hypothetical protein Pfo_005106, partial [Paulownia fortunei]